jgi:protein-S-isoprenylcysteine O-methyltransferase Ste14
MRSNKHSLTPGWSLFEFVVRRRSRILFTIVLALAVDSLGGRLLRHELADVHDPNALLGLALVLTGFMLLAWAVGSRGNRARLTGSESSSYLENPTYMGMFASLLGLGLLVDDPKNIWLLLGPVILLDLVRVAREDCNTSHPDVLQRQIYRRPVAVRAKGSYQADWPRRFGRIAPILIVPIVTLAVITYASPLVSLHFHEIFEIFCLILSLAGLSIRMLAAGYAPGRSSASDGARQPTTPLITDGIYSIVRHPRYVGDYCIGLGVVLIPFVWWLPVLYTLAFWLYYRRTITIDEGVLRRKYGNRYDQWLSTTPALLPRISRWQPTSSLFSFRTALKREHAGLILVIALHSSVEWLEHLVLERRVMLELFWIVLTAIGLFVFVVIRQIDRHTRILNVPAP